MPTTKTKKIKAWGILIKGKLSKTNGYLLYDIFTKKKYAQDDAWGMEKTIYGVEIVVCEISYQLPSKRK